MWHRDIPLGNNHRIHNWEVANQSARLALTVTADDLHKVAYQVDNESYYSLIDNSPVTWVLFAGVATQLTPNSQKIVVKTTDYTATNFDFTIVTEPSSTAINITLPTEASSYTAEVLSGQVINVSQDAAVYGTNIKKSNGELLATIPKEGGVINFQSTGTKWIRVA